MEEFFKNVSKYERTTLALLSVIFIILLSANLFLRFQQRIELKVVSTEASHAP